MQMSNQFELRRQRCKLTSNCPGMQYILIKYVVDDNIAEANLDITDFKEHVIQNAVEYAPPLCENALCCERVINESSLKEKLIEGLTQLILQKDCQSSDKNGGTAPGTRASRTVPHLFTIWQCYNGASTIVKIRTEKQVQTSWSHHCACQVGTKI